MLFLLSVCTFFTIACTVWENSIGQHFRDYLPWEKIVPTNVVQGSTVIGLLVFFSYAIVLNTFVPISLYVSVEVSIQDHALGYLCMYSLFMCMYVCVYFR